MLSQARDTTYLVEIPDFLTFDVLSIDVFRLLIMCNTVASLLDLDLER